MAPVAAAPALPPAVALTRPAVVQKAKPAPYGWTTYTVRNGDTLAGIAVRTGTTPGALAARNKLKGGGNHLSIGQKLSVPKTAGQARAEAAKAKAAAAARAAAIRRATYVVRSGDTLSAIASRKGVSLASLLKTNRLSSRSMIHPGQKLRIPGAGGAPRVGGGAPAVSTATYKVRSGDTLSTIATRTKTSLGTIYKLNRLNSRSVIHPGQSIKVRGTAKASSGAKAGATAYTVRSGDTLSGIAARKGVSLAALLKANGLSSRSVIYPGKKLRVPGGATKTSTNNTFAGRSYPQATVSSANRNRAALASASVPSRSQTRAMIVATARRQGVDPRLALAVAWQESGWNQRQVSVANAIGVMQVIPSSGQWASDMVGRRLNLMNTQDNITAGVAILRSLQRSAKNTDQAIAGYYQGLYSVQKNGMYADTKSYVAAVKAHRSRM